jgi:hypothetical protein
MSAPFLFFAPELSAVRSSVWSNSHVSLSKVQAPLL